MRRHASKRKKLLGKKQKLVERKNLKRKLVEHLTNQKLFIGSMQITQPKSMGGEL